MSAILLEVFPNKFDFYILIFKNIRKSVNLKFLFLSQNLNKKKRSFNLTLSERNKTTILRHKYFLAQYLFLSSEKCFA